MRSLLWTLIALLLLTFVFGVYIAAMVAQYMLENGENNGEDVGWLSPADLKTAGIQAQLRVYFSSLPTALLTMFQCTTGGIDWADVSTLLFEVNVLAVMGFLFYVCMVVFAIMNILTGVCVNQASHAAQEDMDFLVAEDEAKHKRMIDYLKSVFTAADADEVGTMTWSQLQTQLAVPTVKDSFRVLGFETWDLLTFFELLQTGDEIPRVSIKQFIRGCVRLKGPAKNIDVVALRHEMEARTLDLREQITNDIKEALGEALGMTDAFSGQTPSADRGAMGSHRIGAQRAVGARMGAPSIIERGSLSNSPDAGGSSSQPNRSKTAEILSSSEAPEDQKAMSLAVKRGKAHMQAAAGKIPQRRLSATSCASVSVGKGPRKSVKDCILMGAKVAEEEDRRMSKQYSQGTQLAAVSSWVLGSSSRNNVGVQ